jgi:hypothetical protein
LNFDWVEALSVRHGLNVDPVEELSPLGPYDAAKSGKASAVG